MKFKNKAKILKSAFLLAVFLVLAGCQRQLPANNENLKKIFATKDFTVKFYVANAEHFMGFRQDYVTYKHEDETIRETISYDQALLVNNFIQQQLKNHNQTAAEIVF